MSELNADLRSAIAPTMRDNLRERGFAIIGVKPEAAVGDPPPPLDAGCLHHDQSRT